jgi:hypothetical protein
MEMVFSKNDNTTENVEEGLRSKSSAKHKIHNSSPPKSFTESRPPSDWCRVSGNPLELQLSDYLFLPLPKSRIFQSDTVVTSKWR